MPVLLRQYLKLGGKLLGFRVDPDFSDALEYYHRALRSFEELGHAASVALNLGNIGIVHASLKEFEKAMEYFKKAGEDPDKAREMAKRDHYKVE